jgi:ubiquinone/menaquinone biosynthesis C-methylase UbiE
MTNLFDGRPKRMLHVAPEGCFEKRLENLIGDGYITADISDSLAMVKMDINDINYPEESFDVIYCSHVLEHVADDRRAMREFYRVLKADGWAILLVPVTAEVTIEDLATTDPAERLRLFGQEDHVRRYGPDYVERLREAGLRVEVTTASDFLSDKQILQMGITGVSGEIYYCTK